MAKSKSHTKKVGAAGRYGVRYGTKLRKAVTSIERIQRRKQECPSCKKLGIKRVAMGIWECRKCGAKYAGGAYKL